MGDVGFMKKEQIVIWIENTKERLENIEHVLVQLINYVNPGEEEWHILLVLCVKKHIDTHIDLENRDCVDHVLVS